MRSAALAVLALLAGAATGHGPDAPALQRIGAEVVKRAFAAGAPLVETEAYKVHASRRDAPGEAEIHARDTDIFYLLEGTATLVSGGMLREPREVAPHELRGAAIEGGSEQRIAAGDVIVIPSGVPHWFRSVDSPVVYYVVKVTGRGHS
jgi:mannose-6-phosphate isomerase-like protein (cupin superfamily)